MHEKYINMKKITIFLIALVFLFSNKKLLFAQDAPMQAIILSANKSEYMLGRHYQIFKDTSAKLTYTQVSSNKYDNLFYSSKEDKPSVGYSSAAFWLRFKIENPFQSEKEYILELEAPLLDNVTLFSPTSLGSIQEKKVGDLMPFNDREIRNKNHAFRIKIPARNTSTYYMRVYSQSSLHFGGTLWEEPEFQVSSSNEQTGFGIYIGIMIAMIFYNFFIFLSLRDSTYLHYVSSIVAVSLFQLSYNGMAYQFFWSSSPKWHDISVPFFIALGALTSLNFATKFLNTKENVPKWLNKVILGLTIYSVLVALLSFVVSYGIIIRFSTLSGLLMSVVVVISSIFALRKGFRPARFFLVAWSMFLLGVFVTVLRGFGILPYGFVTNYSIPIGAAIEVILLSLGLADRIAVIRRELTQKTLQQARLESEKERERNEFVEDQNKRLEDLVATRTIDLADQNRKMTASIRYAERIQKAILPQKSLIAQTLPDSFIYFKPRDIVSGDFYWFAEKGDKIVIAVVDCTGHGVPGAFMSMIGNTLLNQIVHERGITRPAEVLNQLHEEIKTALKQTEDRNKDGMDIGLCVVHRDVNMIEFAGAEIPLLLMRNGNLEEIKADKRSIGGSSRSNSAPFTNHFIKVKEGEEITIYLSSDGYADQFGGDDNTKFMSKKFRDLLINLNHNKTLKSQHIQLNKVMEEWKGTHRQIDDILVVGFKIKGIARKVEAVPAQEMTNIRKELRD